MTRLNLILLSLLAALAVQARTAADFFKSAPDSIVPLLPANTRLDMVDYFEYGSTTPSRNSFGGDARMLAVAPQVVTLTPAPDVTMQIAALPTAQSDTVVAVVTTVKVPVSISSIRFYNTDWQPVKTPFTLPSYDQWLTPEGQADPATVGMYLPFMPVSASFDPRATMLLLANEAEAYLVKSEFDLVKPLIITSKAYDVAHTAFTPR